MDERERLIETNPALQVDYSPELKLSISCVEVEGLSAGVESRFHVTCRFMHPGGYFEYASGGLLFDIEGPTSFSSFTEALQSVRRGETSRAVLKDVSEDFVLTIETADSIFRRVHIRLSAKEYVGGVQGYATAQFAVDSHYDLYVNRLAEAMVAFMRDLRRFANMTRQK